MDAATALSRLPPTAWERSLRAHSTLTKAVYHHALLWKRLYTPSVPELSYDEMAARAARVIARTNQLIMTIARLGAISEGK